MQNIFIILLHLAEKVDEVDNMIFFIGAINKGQFSSPKVSSTFSLKMNTLMKHFIATLPFGNIYR